MVRAAVAAQRERVTPGIEDMTSYLDSQVTDDFHREVIGPVLAASGASGVVVHGGERVASWGDPSVPEMAFSATKSVVSTVAGLAFDAGQIPDVHRPVAGTLDMPELEDRRGSTITWHHLLQQTGQWDGELWGKPAWADAGSHRPGSAPPDALPGAGWAYNDVRVNLLCLALTRLFGRPLPAVLRDGVLGPLGASGTWSWHGYRGATTGIGGEDVPVVSGGAHWGGGLWISADDLALLGLLYLRDGYDHGRRLLSAEWIDRTWRPCDHNQDYGYLWWLNDRQRVYPAAPASGRCARGNGGRHLLWVDPERDLVIVSRWGEDAGQLLHEVSAAIS
ncbi:serine hydrolase domain-containing protein [Amycolatopsis azurea]|uniref:Beta-lactamase class C protein n=1 Tax=Amycolatopsis azurea DSM 43854 TaxID=1238180 RepID=M2P0V8_9PSEU|nr:hydrolase [Amycolatopsis azurea]EMD28674.1 Beta-lactamase class C protein [Amycolatopsis azurea DSM 43854]OOC07869.1 hydrolase [Amycolatopsis azurea DSM 43854]